MFDLIKKARGSVGRRALGLLQRGLRAVCLCMAVYGLPCGPLCGPVFGSVWAAAPPVASPVAPSLWIDADPACAGRFYEDVDDCWALFVLLQEVTRPGSSWRLRGVSTVFGNTSGESAWQHTQQWLSLLRRDWPGQPAVPAYRGRSVPVSRSDQASPAEIALIDALSSAAPRSMTMILLGPVSNLAAVLKARPALAQGIARVIMLGGQYRDMPHWLPVNGRLSMRDYNVIKDPLAMQWLLQTGLTIDFVPVQAAFGHWLKHTDLAPLVQARPALRWLTAQAAGWERFWRWGFGTPGYPPFDLLAAGLVLQPERFDCRLHTARMDTFPTWWGRQPGLLLEPQGGVAAGPSYRRCLLSQGRALDFIARAVRSAPRENR